MRVDNARAKKEKKHTRTLANGKNKHICSLSFHPIHPSNQSSIHTLNQPQSLNYFICQLARLRDMCVLCTVCMNNSRLFFIWNAQLTTKILSHLNARLFTCQVIFSGIFFLLSPFLSFVCACFFRALVIWTFKNKINFVIVNFSLLCSSSKMLLFFLLFAHSLTHSSVRCVFLSSS